MRSIKKRDKDSVIGKVVISAIIGICLSVSLLFLTAWAIQDSVEITGTVHSDHTTSMKLRLREVLLESSQIWEQIINSQIAMSDDKGTNPLITAGYVMSGIDLNKPTTFLVSQLPGFDTAIDYQYIGDVPDETIMESSGPTGVTATAANGAGYELTWPSSWSLDSEEPLVFIYHTHNTEAYIPNSGTRYQENGTDNTVVEMGDYLTQLLNDKYDIPVLHSQKNHIWEPFWAAYTHSLQTVETSLSNEDSIHYVLDIHNDGVSKEMTTVKIAGQSYARLYFVVGSDRVRNPRWQQNYQFALRIQEKCEQRYPGLSRGILLQDTARYNQHLCDNSILIEMGGYLNSAAEARRSTAILADLLAEIVMEDITTGAIKN